MWVRSRLLVLLYSSVFRSHSTAAYKANPHVYTATNYSSRIFRLSDDMSDIERERNYSILWYDEVSSTMDKARDLCTLRRDAFFAVAAGSQTNARGTRGRNWIAPKGNLFLTVSIKRSAVPVPITLLPLRVGTIIASCMARRVATDTQVKLKWPNDILIDSKKACGVLIEMEGDMLLIGIGCNVLEAPAVNAATNNALASPLIRASTCLADHNPSYAVVAAQRRQQQAEEAAVAASTDTTSIADSSLQTPSPSSSTPPSTTGTVFKTPVVYDEPQPLIIEEGDYHKELAIEICDNLHDWLLSRSDSAALVLQDFTANMDYAPQRLRDEPNEAIGIVVPTGLNDDGTLRVKYAHNGEPGVLCAEYLW